MTRLVLSFLGSFQATRAEQAVVGFESNKGRALLAYLAIEADRPHSRDELTGILWPDQPDGVARTNLRQALANLRHTLELEAAPQPLLLVTRESIQFNLAADHWLDCAEFSALVAASQAHAHRRADACLRCTQWLQQAAELYRGNFLEHFFVSESTAFEEWALTIRERFRQLALEALYRLADFHAHAGEYEQACQMAARQLALDPWREEAHRQAMQALVLNGQRNAALAHYVACRRRLAAELGVEPTDETKALYRQIKLGQPAGGAAFPQFPGAPAALLPAQLDVFIGREKELAEILELLNTPTCRLVTLTGPGGIGKTRLAERIAAEQVRSFADGVCFVPLSALKSADSLIPVIAERLGFAFSSPGDPRQQIMHYLRPKEMLLVFDNFEHLLSESGEAVGLLAELLNQAPRLSLLATSRVRLNLQAEWVYDLQGLAVPEHDAAGDIEKYSAVQLFLLRARQVRREFSCTSSEASAVAHICQLVEGLPLAIELAAAAVRVRTCAAIAAEIETGVQTLTTTMQDVPERHRSLWAVFEHSWRLLSPPEQSTLRRLSVFRGGFLEKAAAQVAQAEPALLWALVDKSLLKWDGAGRCELHELVRQYAGEKLVSAGEREQTQRRHATCYLELAEQAELPLRGAQQQSWIERLAPEHDNLRAALGWSCEQDGGQMAARIAGAIWLFWWAAGHLSEGRRWLERALQASSPSAAPMPPEVRAKVLNGAGGLAYQQSDYASANALLTECLALRAQIGNTWTIANVLNNLGLVATEQGDVASAKAYCEESLALFRALGDDDPGVQRLLSNLANQAFDQGDYALSNRLWEESLALSRRHGDKAAIALALTNLGWAWLLQNDPGQAAACCREALVLSHELGNQPILIFDLEGLAGVAGAQGQPVRAARLFGAAQARREAIHFPLNPSNQAYYQQISEAVHRQMSESAFAAECAQGRSMAMEEAVAYALEE